MTEPLLPYFKADNVDSLIRWSFETLIEHGEKISPTKGAASEMTGVTLELTNPRARLSQSYGRGKVISALGELSWYLSGSNDGRFMSYYIPGYENNADEPESPSCVVHGAYGPRIFGGEPNQFSTIIDLLTRKPSSRQAVIQVYDQRDIVAYHREGDSDKDIRYHTDIPCTCTLQFLLRDNGLNLVVYMRSNDVYKGLSHDIFSFTMIQEIMSCMLKVEIGNYKHIVGSFHLYDCDLDKATEYLSEGHFSPSSMMSMPVSDITKNVAFFIESERQIRVLGTYPNMTDCTSKYWEDLIIVLYARYLERNRQYEEMGNIIEKLHDKTFAPYIIQRLKQI